jgi:hypothetical protein
VDVGSRVEGEIDGGIVIRDFEYLFGTVVKTCEKGCEVRETRRGDKEVML